MQMMKRNFGKTAVLLTLASILAMTGCSNNGNDNGGNTASTPAPTPAASTDSGTTTEASYLPLVDQKMDLDAWVLTDGNFRGTDYNEKVSFQKMEELTNIGINWVQGSGVNGPEAFNLLMVSGQIPDIVFYTAMNTEGPKYGQQGAFVELSQYIDEHAPNFKKILEENPDVKKLLSTADGKIYHFPQLNLHEYNLVQMFPQIRQDWLDKLGLQAPTTTDEWYEVLKAFKTGDPNGNGQADEIPYVTNNFQTLVRTFAPAFGADWEFYLDNGTVKFGPNEERYKETIQFLNKLYSEGLLDANYLVDTEFKFLTEKVTTDRAGAWAGWSGSYMRSFTDLMIDHPTFQLTGLQAPAGPHGDKRFGYHAWPVGVVGLAVSAQSENIIEAIKWIDFQYSEEGVMLNNFGVEGQSYDLVDGYPKFSDVVFNNPEGLNSTESLLSFTVGGGSWATISDERYLEQYDIPEAADAKFRVGQDIDFTKAMPPITLSEADSEKVTALLADIRTFRDEYVNAYIMGNRTFDKYDTEFIGQLEKMKIDEVIAIYQSAYDIYNSSN